MKVTKKSRLTGVEHTLELDITKEQLKELETVRFRRPIQEIIPQLTAEGREFLMTGITPEEWDALVGEHPYTHKP